MKTLQNDFVLEEKGDARFIFRFSEGYLSALRDNCPDDADLLEEGGIKEALESWYFKPEPLEAFYSPIEFSQEGALNIPENTLNIARILLEREDVQEIKIKVFPVEGKSPQIHLVFTCDDMTFSFYEEDLLENGKFCMRTAVESGWGKEEIVKDFIGKLQEVIKKLAEAMFPSSEKIKVDVFSCLNMGMREFNMIITVDQNSNSSLSQTGKESMVLDISCFDPSDIKITTSIEEACRSGEVEFSIRKSIENSSQAENIAQRFCALFKIEESGEEINKVAFQSITAEMLPNGEILIKTEFVFKGVHFVLGEKRDLKQESNGKFYIQIMAEKVEGDVLEFITERAFSYSDKKSFEFKVSPCLEDDHEGEGIYFDLEVIEKKSAPEIS